MAARTRTLAVSLAVAALVAAVTAPDASAAGGTLTPGASAYSAAAGTGTQAMHANLQLTGPLGSFLDSLIDPILNDDLNPLLAALQGSANGAVAGVLGASSALQAATDPADLQVTTAPQAFPNDTCATSGATRCYSAASATVNGAPLASIDAGALSGYVEQVDASVDATNPIFGRASAASAAVTVLPGAGTLVSGVSNPLVSVGAVDSKANCPNDGVSGASKPTTPPSVNVTATGVTLLGGMVKFDVQDGQLANLWVNGTQYQVNGPKNSGIPELGNVTVGSVTISPYGSAILVSLPLSVDQVLTGLGLPASVISALEGLTPKSSVTLSLVVGPNSTVTNRTASAWGLGVGVDLSGSLSFSLFNVVTATFTIPSGMRRGNYGNMLDLRLAYSSCVSGFKPATQGDVPPIPPALV